MSKVHPVPAKLPKADMHVHISMAWTEALFRRFLEEGREGLDEAVLKDKHRRYYETLEHHHQMYESLRRAVTPDDLTMITQSYLECIAERDGAIYAEVQNSYRADPRAFEQQINAITAGILAAKESTGIEARIVVTALRDHGPENAERAAQFLTTYKQAHPDTLVTGYGLVGSENPKHGSLHDFSHAMHLAWHEAGLGLTPHVAEQYVMPAIDFFGAVPVESLGFMDPNDPRRLRAGHATLIHTSTELMNRFADNGVCIESCPSSNKRLGLPDETMQISVGQQITGHSGHVVTLDQHLSVYFNNISKHPLPVFLRRGIPVCLGSDNPFLDNTSGGKEHAMALQTGAVTGVEGLLNFTRNAIRYANIDPVTRTALLKKVDDYERNPELV